MTATDTIVSDEREVARMLTRMVNEIIKKHTGAKNLGLIGIHTRGVPLARRIREAITATEDIALSIGAVDINLYRDDWTRISHHPVVKTTDIPFDLNDRQIILVDDVLFTGRTIRAALDALNDFGRPHRIELAVMVDRGFRELPIQADYIGKFIETRKEDTINVLLSETDGVDRIMLQRNGQSR